ncbi:membrane-bound lytic murein transglycosylase B [Enhydrobacter aerosaccus]|uniref:Membrane-bound lytic murein transglycosylase B n=1 Tax=Enhydrobacter aerosaccus TaxID=225324 RepID=A0A1T4S8M0_9HYPH|nr:lytic murein transglycosylase [Enhydrobacter aerosaccus]SKA24248.1 membrane-bound lytic murein transglycosylase B [Enhydrobacter aerosaccus]
MVPLHKITLLAATTALLSAPAFAQSEFRDCLQAIKTEAVRQGVPAAVADQAFQNLTPDQKVLDLDSRQPEFTLTYGRYIGNAVTPDRVAKGQQKLAQYRSLLDSLQREYGVPPQYLIAFWGMETNYGTFLGDFSVVRSVATLACMTKRIAFFTNETVQALRILATNGMTSSQLRGSWAGAMGNMQFMPSTFMKYAVDRDGNGRIDLWNSMPDAFASAANFLRGIGFRPGLPSSDEVFLPQNFPLEQADMSVEKPVKAWAAMGVRRAGGAALPASDDPSSIILPAGWRGPAFILYPNFKAVMNWNRSTLYALAVGILARQIAGGPGVMQAPPDDDQPLSRETVIEMQTRLARLGFYSDEPDGLLGPKTRSAVRMFQKQVGLPADGHPTPELVQRLMQAVR